jgi:predicted unusual protein kinase regulating ubiquinone biosynthesis (AarF/ABC1/UbiB family)
MTDTESNRLSRRIARYARVGAGVGGAAARIGGARLMGRDFGDPRNAADLVATLGGLKGPLMKVAQMMATIPDLLPGDFAAELQKLQAEAPPMGPAFVRRRMVAELGPDWERRFAAFDKTPAAAASLGQVHRATAHDGRALAVKLQYPDMKSAVEADLSQLGIVLALQRRFSPEIDTTEIAKEVGERLREELDYAREARHMALYGAMLKGSRRVRVPEALPELSTERLLTMTWLDGKKLLGFVDHGRDDRNAIATALFEAWWRPFAHHGVIHGDPHLGNYSVREADGRPTGINLLDFGCVRIFPPVFVDGVVGLYRALKAEDREAIVGAFEAWGFRGLNRATIDTLTIWARFIYSPLLDDRVRTIADGVAPQNYGRKEVWEVKKRLKPENRITIPREFVLMDRAAIGLGSVMLHLKAELNFHRLFESMIGDFDAAALARRQAAALKAAGLA